MVTRLDDIHLVKCKILYYREAADNEKVARERRDREANEVVLRRPQTLEETLLYREDQGVA
jgi:hypothetical protein